jgi:DNA replication and repair protein RecF
MFQCSKSITSIALSNFRNHRKKSFEFSSQTTLTIGPNGSGKTNILEAVHLLATGESWRAEDAGEMVGFEGEVGHIEGIINDYNGEMAKMAKNGYNHSDHFNHSNHSIKLNIVLTRGNVGGKRVAKTGFKVDEMPRRKTDFSGVFKVVLFEPESLQIIIGDPSQRRKFLDEILKQTDKDYANSLSVYSKALRVRNKLLDAIRDGRSRRDGLEYWERAMVKHGELLQNKRRELVEWINFKTDKLQIEYQLNSISADRLEKYREREIEAGFTFVGPQRDDLQINKMAIMAKNGYNHSDHSNHFNPSTSLSSFGSRGEQRMAVLQMKLLEAKWIEEKSEVSPVILLDDIFSELDVEHEQMVGELVGGRQAIITATEIHKEYYPGAEMIALEH